jgi:UDP-N-acetyl-D-mannosaminuronate dehydrogenase
MRVSELHQRFDELHPAGKNMAQPADVATRAVIGDLTIGIIGLGYVGLPTAIGFHDAGFNVWGVDVSQRTVDMVRAGKNPTGDPDVNDIIPAPGTDRWNITTSTAEAVPHCDAILVTVPTPITHDLKPDLSYVAAAGARCVRGHSKGLEHHCCP